MHTREVTEGRGIPSQFLSVRNSQDFIDSRINELMQSGIAGMSYAIAHRIAEDEVKEREYPEMSHPRPGGTRKHKKSKKKGTRKNKKRIK